MGETKNLMPAVVQDYRTGEVLMLAYVDPEAVRRTKETGTTWFWSRSRNEYWNKGATSGNKQIIKEIRFDCDEDSYLFMVEQMGDGACHTGNRSCFYRSDYVAAGRQPLRAAGAGVLAELYETIESRKKEMPDGSYTAELLRADIESVLAKVEEESGEVVEAARIKDDSEVAWEAADLIYHLFVLLVHRGITLDRLSEELAGRRK